MCRYIKVRKIIDLIQSNAENTQLEIFFHDFPYRPHDLVFLQSKFPTDDQKHVKVSISNDSAGIMTPLSDKSAVLIMNSSSTPYRQIISEHVLLFKRHAKPYPRAVICFPAEDNDGDPLFAPFARNDSSDVVKKWLACYTDEPLRLTEKDDLEYLKNMVFHTQGRVSAPEPSATQ